MSSGVPRRNEPVTTTSSSSARPVSCAASCALHKVSEMAAASVSCERSSCENDIRHSPYKHPAYGSEVAAIERLAMAGTDRCSRFFVEIPLQILRGAFREPEPERLRSTPRVRAVDNAIHSSGAMLATSDFAIICAARPACFALQEFAAKVRRPGAQSLKLKNSDPCPSACVSSFSLCPAARPSAPRHSTPSPRAASI